MKGVRFLLFGTAEKPFQAFAIQNGAACAHINPRGNASTSGPRCTTAARASQRPTHCNGDTTMTGITTAKTTALIAALALSLATTSTFAETRTSKAKKGHAASATASVKTQTRMPTSPFAAERGVSSRASIDQRPDVPGYPQAQAAQ
jgi:hypothetical protein